MLHGRRTNMIFTTISRQRIARNKIVGVDRNSHLRPPSHMRS